MRKEKGMIKKKSFAFSMLCLNRVFLFILRINPVMKNTNISIKIIFVEIATNFVKIVEKNPIRKMATAEASESIEYKSMHPSLKNSINSKENK